MGVCELIQADVVRWVAGLVWLTQAGYLTPYQAVFCDPPYFLASIAKRFGPGQKEAQYGKDGLFQRQSRGFMGKEWDGFDSPWAYQEWVTSWARPMLGILYPGALGVFFGGTRTHHRLASGLEDAGWEIIDELQYLYGSGLPKPKNVGDGYGTALKPAFEPAILARAPRGKYTYEQLFRTFGTGSFNIDGARVAAEPWTRVGELHDIRGGRYADGGKGSAAQPSSGKRYNNSGSTDFAFLPGVRNGDERGRHPPNIILDDHTARMVDAQSGERRAGGSLSGNEPSEPQTNVYAGGLTRQEWDSYDDEGGASRFFYTAKAATWERTAGIGQRSTHPTVKPIELTEYIARLLLAPERNGPSRLLVPFAGVGSEMIGARLAGWGHVTGLERETEYVEQGLQRLEWWGQFSSYQKAKEVADAERRDSALRADGQLSLLDFIEQNQGG
jgi:site-specific DNA-methyltransferase (adenine-specific)